MAVEDIYGVEESEEVDTEKIEDCEIIDTEGNVISSTDSSDIGDWEKRHNEIEEQREKIRNRVRKTRSGNGVIREAKPKPTISDTGHKQVGVYARVSTKSTNQVYLGTIKTVIWIINYSNMGYKSCEGEHQMGKSTRGYCKYCGKEYTRTGMVSR